jgi:hypothetical protein
MINYDPDKVNLHEYEVTEIVNVDNMDYIGCIGIARNYAGFSCADLFAFSGQLSPESRFDWEVHEADGPILVKFIVFDPSKTSGEPEVLFCGWMPAGKQLQAAELVARGNALVAASQLAERGGSGGG